MSLSLYEVVRGALRESFTFEEEPHAHILAQNVYDYTLRLLKVSYPRGTTTSKDLLESLCAIPSIAPPFPAWWTEFRWPGGAEFGVYVRTVEAHAAPEIPSTIRRTPLPVGIQSTEELARRFGSDIGLDTYEEMRRECRWVSTYTIFVLERQRARNPLYFGEFIFGVNADGTIWGCDEVGIKAVTYTPSVKLYGVVYDQSRVIPMIAGACLPAFMTAAFLTTNNVVAEPVRRSTATNWMRKERDYSIPGVVFKVLKIKPMIKILREEGHSDTQGIKALHICRGHWKTYAERGLFGREDSKGTFFFNEHHRGKAENGTVAKAYELTKERVEEGL